MEEGNCNADETDSTPLGSLQKGSIEILGAKVRANSRVKTGRARILVER